MNGFKRILRLTALVTLVGTVCGCYVLVFRGQDEKNLRQQFHVPSDVRAAVLDGQPRSAGLFGREGLRIHAVFEFDDDQFQRYVAAMDDPEVWTPESLVAYSPARAEAYSEDSMSWRDLPVPAWTEDRLRYWPSLPAVRQIQRGRVHCSAITIVQGERIEHPDGNYHHAWHYLGRSCAEVEDARTAAVVVLGVIDFDARRLYAHIAFSG